VITIYSENEPYREHVLLAALAASNRVSEVVMPDNKHEDALIEKLYRKLEYPFFKVNDEWKQNITGVSVGGDVTDGHVCIKCNIEHCPIYADSYYFHECSFSSCNIISDGASYNRCNFLGCDIYGSINGDTLKFLYCDCCNVNFNNSSNLFFIHTLLDDATYTGDPYIG